MMLATAVALVIGGPGVLSFDYWLARRKQRAGAEQGAAAQTAGMRHPRGYCKLFVVYR
jgi:hypothetical protein